VQRTEAGCDACASNALAVCGMKMCGCPAEHSRDVPLPRRSTPGNVKETRPAGKQSWKGFTPVVAAAAEAAQEQGEGEGEEEEDDDDNDE